MNICEAFAKKLDVSAKVYAKEHGNAEIPQINKVAIARVLANTSEYLNEAFDNSVGTQLGDMKKFKKFCLDLTTVALPNLIANDLVIVYPMKSRTGYIQYLQFTANSNKGGVSIGDVWNDPFKLGEMNDNRVAYTSAFIPEVLKVTEGKVTFTWGPARDARIIDAESGESITVDEGGKTATVVTSKTEIKVGYIYDNVSIPQNDIPTFGAHMEGISLHAKARRIRIYFSQMAAFQAKTEMGIDLGEVLATQACAELSYEIDTEIVKLLKEGAGEAKVSFNKHLPVGVSKRDHYAGFAETVAEASQKIYDATQKHNANYMVCSSSVRTLLSMVEGFKAASTVKVNGPYFAGTLDGLKVYVAPYLKPGEFFCGFNGGDMVTSAAVYAPYMAIVPTQLLGFADGAMEQGFSTMYDLVLLNKALLVAGEIVDVADEDATKVVRG